MTNVARREGCKSLPAFLRLIKDMTGGNSVWIKTIIVSALIISTFPTAFPKFDKNNNYDYESAIEARLHPDKTGHWPSHVPSGRNEGLILKHETHPTFYRTIQTEHKHGYELKRLHNRLYSFKREE